jgi:hypothetical protein
MRKYLRLALSRKEELSVKAEETGSRQGGVSAGIEETNRNKTRVFLDSFSDGRLQAVMKMGAGQLEVGLQRNFAQVVGQRAVQSTPK